MWAVILPGGGSELSSSGSEKVSVSVDPLIDALSSVGDVVSSGVSLVTVWAAKSGTGSFALSASLELVARRRRGVGHGHRPRVDAQHRLGQGERHRGAR